MAIIPGYDQDPATCPHLRINVVINKCVDCGYVFSGAPERNALAGDHTIMFSHATQEDKDAYEELEEALTRLDERT